MAVTEFEHTPVMLDRVLDIFAPVGPGTVVDLTLGGAGHAAALLDARPDVTLLGIDRDPEALAAAAPRLARFGERVQTVHARSDQLTRVLADRAIDDVVAVLADLGVSSHQIDSARRGFSYRPDFDGPLDMRMDTTRGTTAAMILNESPEGELAAILRNLGDERFARRIAAMVVAARPLHTTAELAELVKAAIPAPARRRGGNPAKRTFQALRIAVNDELGVLTRTLDQIIDVLTPGGRAAVISFQSGEDRLVKARFRTADDGGCTCPPGLPCACGATPTARLLKRGGWTASEAEQSNNPRAASARLRAVEKLPNIPNIPNIPTAPTVPTIR